MTTYTVRKAESYVTFSPIVCSITGTTLRVVIEYRRVEDVHDNEYVTGVMGEPVDVSTEDARREYRALIREGYKPTKTL